MLLAFVCFRFKNISDFYFVIKTPKKNGSQVVVLNDSSDTD